MVVMTMMMVGVARMLNGGGRVGRGWSWGLGGLRGDNGRFRVGFRGWGILGGVKVEAGLFLAVSFLLVPIIFVPVLVLLIIASSHYSKIAELVKLLNLSCPFVDGLKVSTGRCVAGSDLKYSDFLRSSCHCVVISVVIICDCDEQRPSPIPFPFTSYRSRRQHFHN